jgi:hypothetical protein
MDAGGASLARRAEADDGLAGDHHRLGRLHGEGQCRLELVEIMPVDAPGCPAIAGETFQRVFGGGKVGAAIDGDTVIVEQHHQLVELEMPGECAGLVAHAFHQAAIAGDHPGAVVDQALAEFCRQQAFRERHAHGSCQALAKRAGGHFDGRVLVIFRVAGGHGMKLAEGFQVVDIHALVPGEVQQCVKQHGTVAG